MNAYVLLAISIIFEVLGSTCLAKSENFTKLLPSCMVIILFTSALYIFSFVLKTIPLGVAYAIWAGVGIVLTVCINILFFKQSVDFPAILGIVLIILGVVVINLFSKTAGH